MKKTFLYGCAALAFGFAACSDDDVTSEAPSGGRLTLDGPGAYISVNIALPSSSASSMPSTRTTTPTGLTELGKEYENNVEYVAIVLADQNDNYLLHITTTVSGVGSVTPLDAAKTKYGATARVDATAIGKLYDTNTGDRLPGYEKIRVYVVCNPHASFLADLETALDKGVGTGVGYNSDWINSYGTITESPRSDGTSVTSKDHIWMSRQFVMSNVAVAERKIPEKLETWDSYNSEANPFNLSGENNIVSSDVVSNEGAIPVQRIAARFDYKDGSPNTTANSVYNVLYKGATLNEDGTVQSSGEPYIDVELVKMSLTNMSKTFFVFKRTSDDGTITGTNNNYKIFGEETQNNYVVDVDCEWKNNITKKWRTAATPVADAKDYTNEIILPVDGDLADYFNFPFFVKEGENYVFPSPAVRVNTWYTDKVSKILTGTDANDITGTTAVEGVTSGDPKDFHIWRYVVENALPKPTENQVNGLSTGIVFKAKICKTKSAGSAAPATRADDTPSANTLSQNSLISVDDILADYETELINALDGADFPNVAEGMKPTGAQEAVSYTQLPILYLFHNKLFYTWSHLRAYALLSSISGTLQWVADGDSGHWELNGDNTINRTNPYYKAVFGEGGMGSFKLTAKDVNDNNKVKTGLFTDPNAADNAESAYAPNYLASEWNGYVTDAGGNKLYPKESGDDGFRSSDDDGKKQSAFKKAVLASDITIYQPSYDGDFAEGSDYKSGWGYYCYYYYWNRHNDNEKAGIMGPMEFAVVRNNVYKLWVSKISRLGHPRLLENDPNPPTPDTPDESNELYISVQCQVQPWEVRINEIVF